MKYLQEANLLDRERPEILAWLGICAVELGLVQIAKQAFRQLMRFEERLEARAAVTAASPDMLTKPRLPFGVIDWLVG